MTVNVVAGRRAATVQEIKEVARRQLVTKGAAAVSLRAIAREMGVTAPALYRYVPSLDHLVRSLAGDAYGEVCEAMERARDLIPAEDAALRLIAVCRAFRAWSVGHRAEFGLLFNTPGSAGDRPCPAQAGGARFARIFFDLFAEVWRRHHVASAEDPLDPDVARRLAAYRRLAGEALPDRALFTALSCWTRLYGLVTLEVFNQLRFAPDDAGLFFEIELRSIALRLGMPTVSVGERFPTIS